MEAAYDPQRVEGEWYSRWEAAGVFRPEQNPGGPPYCIVIPPPNVTGSLHMGHALNMAVQDALIRRKRMQGYAALWVPGTDHAGIATQNVVERQLAAEGLTRHDLGRAAFIERVWEWKGRHGGRISEQMRRLGYSCDWSRERFTMDEGLSRAVRTVFVRLYEEGIIYRGRRVINWCPRCRTALSDIEVEHEDVTGELVYIEYPFAEGEGGVEVATTRAETMLGDTAVAVHPGDERYRGLIGRLLRLPLVGREIPIIADEAVDPSFGTGAVKVTPAHDPTDFEIAERAGLPAIIVLDEQAAITAAGGPFAGLDRFDARTAVKEALAAAGVLRRIEEHLHAVGHCYRCGTMVEPYLSEQWFVKVRPLVGPAIEAVRSGQVRFVPQRWAKHYILWMENLRDWTISRQIWWGHRIPAWYCAACGRVTVALEDPAACPCGSTDLRQEDDVLDTWFSSALWPFSTLGWPDDTPDLRAFYPNSVLVTAYDIIYFWVARMIQMGLHFAGDVPFADVAIHGLIQAPDKRKMSKSLGNAIDPLDVVAEHGADPLRLSLVLAAAPGHDTVPLQLDQVDAARRFGNKLWNAVRFALRYTAALGVPPSGGYPADPSPEERWILSRLHEVSARFDELFDEYRCSDAFGLLYTFIWAEVCDWFLEMAKAPLRRGGEGTVVRTLGVVLRDVLAMLHPIMPSLTEELWSHLVGEGFVAAGPWPSPPAYEAPEGFAVFQGLVGEIRRFRAEHGLAPRAPLDVVVADPEGVAEPWWREQVESLASVSPQWVERASAGPGRTSLVVGPIQAFVSQAGTADIAAERGRIARAVAEAESLLAASEAKLANPQFRDRAPAEVVDKERSRVAESAARLAKLRAQLEALG
ncbi:MAG TPA: valine--tRNA ligase [Acidimicrobiia bacterium]|nr:valine--tRNA ligase [Acidimicrobiia bacterium]